MKYQILLLFGLLCTGCAKVNKTDSQPPNIVLFFVDDMGWQDTSVPFWDQLTDFNKIYKTPHMERLAKKRSQIHKRLRHSRLFTNKGKLNDGDECGSAPGNKLDIEAGSKATHGTQPS